MEKRQRYEIKVIGCDDDTTVYEYLTEAEAELMIRVARQVYETSTYSCMPVMQVKNADEIDDNRW